MAGVNWKDAAEVLGIAAIVASLIFVGMELHQAQQIALVQQYQDRTDSTRGFILELSDRPIWQQRLANRLRRGWDAEQLSAEDRELLEAGTPQDIADWWVAAELNLMAYDNLFFQYESGFSTIEAWQAQSDRMKQVLIFNSFAEYKVRNSGFRYRATFSDEAKRILMEIEK